MPRGLRVLCMAPVLALWASPVDSTIRINGNQMLDGSAYYNVTSGATAPATIVYNLGQAMLPVGGLPDSGSGTRFGVGLAYDQGRVVYSVIACPVALTGDVNLSGSLTSADIIGMVNYVFKGGTPPLPCAAAGDANGNGSVTSADIIYLVNYVFKGGPPPKDVCTLIPSVWKCP